MAKKSTSADRVEETRVCEDEVYEIDLVDLLLTLWKRKLIILATAFVFIACAAAYIAVAPKIYESSTTLAFLPTSGDNAIRLTPDTYLTLATADDLLGEVLKEISSDASGKNLPSENSLRKGLSVKFVQLDNTRRTQTPTAMTASFRAKDPKVAAKVLSTWSEHFIQKSVQLSVDRNTSAIESLESSVEAAKQDLMTAENRQLAYEKDNPVSLLKIQLDVKGGIYADLLSQQDEKNTEELAERIERTQKEYVELNARILGVETEIERLSHEKGILQQSYDTLSKQYQRLCATTTEPVSSLKVIENPTTPRKPASPRWKRILGLATLLGLFLGTTLALLIELFVKRKNAQ